MNSPPTRTEAIHRLKHRLEGMFNELRDEIHDELLKSDDEHYAALAERVHDVGDESVADLLSDVNLAVIDHHVNELRAVDGALLRIAGGDYGNCLDCGTEIELDRLEAYPTATRCFSCQSRHEDQYAQPPHPKL